MTFGDTTTGVLNPHDYTSQTFELYPNPARSNVNIVSSNGRPFTIQVYNAAGQCFDVQSFQTGRATLSTDWTAGLYFIHIWQHGKLLQQEKLIIADE